MAKVYRESLLDPLVKKNDKIDVVLVDLERRVEMFPSNEKKAILRKWCGLTRQIYWQRRVETNFIKSKLEFDEKLPKEVIQHNGSLEFFLPGALGDEACHSMESLQNARAEELKIEQRRAADAGQRSIRFDKTELYGWAVQKKTTRVDFGSLKSLLLITK